MKSRSSQNPIILAILREIMQYFATFSLKITQNKENCQSWISKFTQMVTNEITFTLDSRKF